MQTLLRPDFNRFAQAEKKLEEMGPITMDEKIMGASLLTTVGLWVFGASIGVGSVPAALVGLGTLLISGVLTWGECLKETVAWDTLTWFGALIAMVCQELCKKASFHLAPHQLQMLSFWDRIWTGIGCR